MSIDNYTDRERALLADCERLTAELDNIKQVEFPKRLRNVTKPIIAQRDALQAKLAALETHNTMLRACLKGVIRVADRKTDEFDAARAALGEQP